MTEKLKRMQIILVIAAILIFFADISLFASTLISENIIKFIIGLIIPTVLLLLSFQVENEFKLEKCSFAIFNISMITYFTSFAGTLDLFFPGKEFMQIGKFYLSIGFLNLLFLTFLAGISYYSQKKKFYLKTGYVSGLLAILYASSGIMRTIGYEKAIIYLPGFIVVAAILLLSSIFCKKEYCNFITVVSAIFIAIFVSDWWHNVDNIALIVPMLSIITSMINIKRVDNKGLDIVSFIALSVALYAEIVYISDIFQDIGIILSLVLIIVIDMLFCVFDIGKDRKQALGYKIFLDAVTIILMITSIVELTHTVFILGLVIGSSLVSTYALKSDKYEQYLLPFKLILSIIGMLVVLNQYITIDFVIIIISVNIASVIGYLASKNKVFKHLFSIIILFSIVCSHFNVDTIFNFLVLITMYSFDYYVFFVLNKDMPKIEPLFYIVTLIFVYGNVDIHNDSIVYLLFTVSTLLIHFLRKEKSIQVISWVAALLGIETYLYRLGLSYELSTFLKQLTMFAGGFYLIKKYNAPDILTILFMIALGLNTIEYSELIGYVVMLAELIFVLFVTYKDKKSIFNVMAIETFIILLCLLNEMDAIPLFVYFLLLGTGAIVVIFMSIKKYLDGDFKKEKEELEHKKVEVNPDFKYCNQCGNRLPKDANFCNKCGNKMSK